MAKSQLAWTETIAKIEDLIDLFGKSLDDANYIMALHEMEERAAIAREAREDELDKKEKHG
jgi:hypothetical protein